jgi:hypothetical protein
MAGEIAVVFSVIHYPGLLFFFFFFFASTLPPGSCGEIEQYRIALFSRHLARIRFFKPFDLSRDFFNVTSTPALEKPRDYFPWVNRVELNLPRETFWHQTTIINS